MNIEEKLLEAGFSLPAPPAAGGNYVPARTVGKLLYLSGVISTGFGDSPKVINGASDLLVKIYGNAGRHLRAAVGVSARRRNALVEVQIIVEIA